MMVFEQVYQLVGSTEVDMYMMSVIEHISLNKTLAHRPWPTPFAEAPMSGVG
jgi:hypothetical protein